MDWQRSVKRPGAFGAALAVAVGAALALLAAAPASADHHKGTYGDHGYVWFARASDNAIAWVTSEECRAAEGDAYTKIHVLNGRQELLERSVALGHQPVEPSV